MEFQVNITVGVTPQLEKLLGGLLQPGSIQQPAAKKTAVIEAEEIVAEEKPKAIKAKKASEKAAEAPQKPETVEANAVVKEEAEKPAEVKETTKAEAKATYTEEDIRTAMHECRCRIEGEDYKENPDSEGYQKHHKNLTAWFRNMAQSLGYDKPSTLPVEMRKKFIDDCQGTIIGGDGGFTVCLPF